MYVERHQADNMEWIKANHYCDSVDLFADCAHQFSYSQNTVLSKYDNEEADPNTNESNVRLRMELEIQFSVDVVLLLSKMIRHQHFYVVQPHPWISTGSR